MQIEQVTPPARLPVTLEQVLTHLKITWPEFDPDYETTYAAELVGINGLMSAAVEYLDGRGGILGRSLLTQKWKYYLDGWPENGNKPITLPFPPIQSVDEVTYLGGDDTRQTLASADYSFSRFELEPAICLSANFDASQIRGLEISYTAGYGDLPSDVPAPIVSAILLDIAHLKDNLSTTTSCAVRTVPHGYDRLIEPHRLGGLLA